MKHFEACPACGAKKLLYRRSVRLAQLRALYRLARVLHDRGGAPMKIAEIPDLPHGTYSDFARLQVFGLIAHAGPADDTWTITPTGYAWLAGRTTIPKYVWTYRNDRLPDPPGEQNARLFPWDVDPQQLSRAQVLAEAKNWCELAPHEAQLQLFL